jgi:hypothetical protein
MLDYSCKIILAYFPNSAHAKPIFNSNNLFLIFMVSTNSKILLCILFFAPFILFANDKDVFAIYSNISSFNLSEGYVNGSKALFLATDSSDNKIATSIDSLGHKINFAPILSSIPSLYLQQGYDFLNGIKGQGSFGFQLPVATSLPGDEHYSPLVQLNFVKWNDGSKPRLLDSSGQIQQASNNGEVQIIKTNIIINSPIIVKQ